MIHGKNVFHASFASPFISDHIFPAPPNGLSRIRRLCICLYKSFHITRTLIG